MATSYTRHAAQLAQPSRCAMCGSHPNTGTVIDLPGLSVDRANRKVWIAGREVTLTSKEFDLLAYFAQRPERVVTKKQLYDDVWGFPVLPRSTRTMESHVSRVRCKITAVESSTLALESVRGIGWRLRAS